MISIIGVFCVSLEKRGFIQDVLNLLISSLKRLAEVFSKIKNMILKVNIIIRFLTCMWTFKSIYV